MSAPSSPALRIHQSIIPEPKSQPGLARFTCQILNSFIGEIFSAVAGFLPVVSFSYIQLPLPFSVSLVISGVCLVAASLTFILGQKCLGMSQGKSFFDSPIRFRLCVQYAAYRCIKAFLQSWGVVTGHLLAQRCFLLTPLVRSLTPLAAGLALIVYLVVDIFILESLRLTKSQKAECGFKNFHLSL